MANRALGADSAPDNIFKFHPRPRPLRADVPPFDPRNDSHLRAWEAMWDFGQRESRPIRPEPTSPSDSKRREPPTAKRDDLDPTRYGDWSKNGRCIDF